MFKLKMTFRDGGYQVEVLHILALGREYVISMFPVAFTGSNHRDKAAAIRIAEIIVEEFAAIKHLNNAKLTIEIAHE